MDRRNEPQDDQDLPLDDPAKAAAGEEAAERLDEVPPPGTDPLHEGP